MTRTRDCAKRQDVRRMLPLVRHEDNIVSLLSRCRSHVGSSCRVSLLCTTDTAGRCGVRQLCPPSKPPARASLEILSYHRQITSHLRKQGTLSITDSISLSPTGLYTPAPRHRHPRPGFASPPPWTRRALVRGRHPPWLKTNRPVLALPAENALKACPHDASAVFSTRASACSRLRRAARQYRRACEG